MNHLCVHSTGQVLPWHKMTQLHWCPQSCPCQAQLRIRPLSHHKLLKCHSLESSPAWSTSPVLVSHALGVAVVISIHSVLLEWNCLEIILSAAHLAFGNFAKRFLALFWNKDSHLYWDFGSIPCCRIFSKLLGASLPHFISWLFWLPPSYFYTEATKIFSSALSLSIWSKSHWTPFKVSQQTFSDSWENIEEDI